MALQIDINTCGRLELLSSIYCWKSIKKKKTENNEEFDFIYKLFLFFVGTRAERRDNELKHVTLVHLMMSSDATKFINLYCSNMYPIHTFI